MNILALSAVWSLEYFGLLERFVFEVRPADPWILTANAATAVLVALVATIAPGLRAGRVDSIRELTAE